MLDVKELKRKSKDMETETEEDLFLAYTNGCETGESNSGSLSLSDQSFSTDNIEEVVATDQPFEGKHPIGMTLHSMTPLADTR